MAIKKDDEDITVVLTTGDDQEDIEMKFTREEMAILSIEAFQHGHSVEEHINWCITKYLEEELKC